MQTVSQDQNRSATRRRATAAAIVSVLLVGIAVRVFLLCWFQDTPIAVNDDIRDYNRIAINLVEHGEFADAPGKPTSMRPPLYPAFLAAIYAVFGVENFLAVRVAQTLLGLLLVSLVYQMARKLYDRRAALWAGGICLLYPSLLGYASLLLSEMLFAVLVCLACLMLQRFFERGGLVDLAMFGVLLGLGALTRSVLWPFLPFLAVYLLCASGGTAWRRRAAVVLTPVVAFAVTVTPWAVRNTRLQETFTVVDVIGGRNMMMGNYEYTPMHRAWDAISVTGDHSWGHVLAAETPGFRDLTQGQRDKAAMRRGAHYALKHPGITLRRDIVKFFNFWQLERLLVAGMASGFWGEYGKPTLVLLAAIICGGYAVAILSAVFGFVLRPPADRRFHWFLLLLIGFICAVHTVVFGHSRYHLSLMPLVFLYSGVALANLRMIWAQRRHGLFWLASFISILLVGSWLWEFFFVDLQKFHSQVLSS